MKRIPNIIHLEQSKDNTSTVPAYAGKNADLMNHLFNPTFAEQYESAIREGNARFGSECKHTEVKDGVCLNCFRQAR